MGQRKRSLAMQRNSIASPDVASHLLRSGLVSVMHPDKSLMSLRLDLHVTSLANAPVKRVMSNATMLVVAGAAIAKRKSQGQSAVLMAATTARFVTT